MATSLESQLIRGAGQAVAKDPRGEIRAAQKYTSQQITGAAAGIAGKHKAKKDLEKKHSDQFDTNEIEYLDNLGLGKEEYARATAYAKEIKERHIACIDAEDPNMCRRKATMELKELGTMYEGKAATTKSFFETKGKIDNNDLELSDQVGFNDRAIMAGINDANGTAPRVVDGKLQSGWNVTYINDDDKEVTEFITEKQALDLQKPVAHEHTTEYNKVLESTRENAKKFKKGDEDGQTFDMDLSINTHAKSISKNNIASLYHDKHLGNNEPLKEHLKEHPILKNATYDSLGISAELDIDGDNIIDPDEINEVINALSNPEHDSYNFEASKKVGAEWMALNEEKEVNKTLYGPEYYPKPSGEDGAWMPVDLTIPDYKGEGDMWFSTPEEYQAALKYDKSTQRDGENDQAFFDRGGIKGAGVGRSKVYKEIYGKSVDIQESIEGESTEDIIAKL